MFTILDDVLDQIHSEILIHPPERGGALFGPVDSFVVTHFILDHHARNTTCLYTPSTELTPRIAEIEGTSDLEFKGIIHSHPGAMDRPSGPDVDAVRAGFDRNPHISLFLLPIVNAVPPARGSGDNVLPVGRGRVTTYVGRRTRSGIAVKPGRLTLLPLSRDMDSVTDYIGVDPAIDAGRVQIEDKVFFARRILLPSRGDFTFLFGLDYPASAPIVFGDVDTAQTEQIRLNWELSRPARERLVHAIKEHFSPEPKVASAEKSSRRYKKGYAAAGGPVVTEDESVAKLAGLGRVVYTRDDVRRNGDKLEVESFARTSPLLGTAKKKMVVVFGAGSVGSYLADQLVRSGIRRLTIVDHDRVEAANLSRTCYSTRDIGSLKTEALRRHLLNVNPRASIDTRSSKLQDIGFSGLKQIIEDADLLIGATDEPAAQRAINRMAYPLGTPTIFCGLWAGAKSGEIIVMDPERSPCFECATAFRNSVPDGADEAVRTNYGTGRLVGEVALSCNIHHVASAAIPLAMSYLVQSESALARMAQDAVASGRSYLIMGMTPDFPLSAVFDDTPGQYAFQSVWVTVPRDPGCTVCGDKLNRLPLSELALGVSPSVEAIRDRMRSLQS